MDFGAAAEDITISLNITGLHAPFEYLKQGGKNSFISNISQFEDQGADADPLNKSMLDKLENLLDYHGADSFNSGGPDSGQHKMSDSALSAAALAVASFQSTHGHEQVFNRLFVGTFVYHFNLIQKDLYKVYFDINIFSFVIRKCDFYKDLSIIFTKKKIYIHRT